MSFTAPSPPFDHRRIIALDALRGAAVGGIALMNIYVYALPSPAYFNPLAAGYEGVADIAVWATSFVFVDNKFRTLFAMLFGLGCAILFERDDNNPLLRHYARMAVLFLFGLAHAILLANNDILRLYAVCGLLLPFVFDLGVRQLWLCTGALMAAHVGMGTVGALGWFAGGFGATADTLALANAVFGTDPETIASLDQRNVESFSERIERRADGALEALLVLSSSLVLNLSAMLAGIALWRGGLLKGEWDAARTRRLALVTASIAIPALSAFAWLNIATNFHPGLVGGVALFWSAPFDLLLGIAYAALAMLAFARGGWLTRRLTAAGRLSLTNYVATSLIFALLFYSWGAGLYRAFSRVELFALAFLPMALMLVWSPLWLGFFRQGPLEWLWRSLSAVRPKPFLR
ncbi:DUF418 domain-containing protein [Aurantiacibacter gangjinensis]|uniref:Uncharacterized protein n=1 Tax=Aurantiacibacter gangjinensis TaxID=502682 RepID=A0A0G9MLW6_9SPHN|nr:DUF418 domain-containing protein [Aurantiacibacter gangjinensis]APE27717.1 hypothetical protein BMF35_a0888 [Aurantiacibacter gangjinensis]KLE31721.1 hypothetical protein AAW01_09430 [Aurantiacibacter gangjinensis]